MRKNLFLLTDVLPNEIPILFNNKPVYLNFTKKRLLEYRKIDLTNNGAKPIFSHITTVPMTFTTPKNSTSDRKISLLHPIAQIQAFNYILQYESQIISFASKTKYSVRAPIKTNHPNLTHSTLHLARIKKAEAEFSSVEIQAPTSEEDKILFYNYFSFNKYSRINQLYTSPKFNRDRYKFKYFRELDISNFFPSIYTHSISWALFGDKAHAKMYKSNQFKNMFQNETDRIMQIINFKETNGIVVGPEFSRTIAELVLIRVDEEIYNSLTKNNILLYRDYNIYRFVDDYNIFTKEESTLDHITGVISETLLKYNLHLNHNKLKTQSRPISVTNQSINKYTTALNEYKSVNLLASITKEIPYNQVKGTKSNWNNLQSNIELIISKQPQDTSKVIAYFLKSIRSHIIFDGKAVGASATTLEVVCNLYSLAINTNNTANLLSIFVKILKMKESLILNHTSELNHSNVASSSFNNFDEILFQNLFRTLKNNISKTDLMYDILIFMKMLNKKLSPQFLCELLSKSDSYFLTCCIGYYILENDNSKVNIQFITVQKKLSKKIRHYIDNYKTKGSDSIFYESAYFYYLNDFKEYPGFKSVDRQYFKQKMMEHIREISTKKGEKVNLKKILASITSHSYFDWGATVDDFIRIIIKKTITISPSDKFDY